MIDCDSVNILNLINEVSRLQQLFHLGDASICSSGRSGSFHIYFWTALNWREAVMVVSMCHFYDMNFLKFSLLRNHFTLRVSDKEGRPIKEVAYVKSKYNTDVHYTELLSFVRYETASGLYKKNPFKSYDRRS